MQALIGGFRGGADLLAHPTARRKVLLDSCVGGGEKGYQNGGEVVPCQGSRSE